VCRTPNGRAAVRWGISLSGSRAQAVSTGLTLPLVPRKRGLMSSHLRNVFGGSPLVTSSLSWGLDCGRCSRIKRSRSSVSPSPTPKTPRHSRNLFLPSGCVGEKRFSSSLRRSMIPPTNHSTGRGDDIRPLTCNLLLGYSTTVLYSAFHMKKFITAHILTCSAGAVESAEFRTCSIVIRVEVPDVSGGCAGKRAER
jgi:hypothetical protein